jgi:Secretion system C-terminal sorting domain
MRKFSLATLFSLLLAGTTQAAVQFTIHITSPTTFEVWMKPEQDITTGGAGISTLGLTFETPPTVNPSGLPSPAQGQWTVVSNPAFFPASPTLLSTQFKQSLSGNWESNFNWNNGTGAGNQTFSAGQEYLLATFTIPAGLTTADVVMKDWSNNRVDNTGAPTWGESIAMGAAPAGIEDPAALFYATAGSTNTATNGGTVSSVSTLSMLFTSLPLNFLSFDAIRSDETVLLKWKTADEVNVKQFQVQRSLNGNDWSTLGVVGALNTTGPNDYSYTDANPMTGNNQYRIAEQDLDGKLMYTGIRIVPFNNGGDLTATLYPVPARTVLTVITHSPVADQVVLRISDMQGKVVRIQEVQLSKGDMTLAPIDLRTLAAGTYTIEIKGTSARWTSRFIKE